MLAEGARRSPRRLLPALLALLALAVPLAACTRSGPDPVEEARALQVELHRALIETRALGRFGELGLFEQEMERVPCKEPLSPTNRVCEVTLLGKGPVRMKVADAQLEASGQLRKDALVFVEYQPECANAGFDLKTVDNVLPRHGPTVDGVTVWQNKLLRVTHRRLTWTPQDKCTLTIEPTPALLERVRTVGALTAAHASR